jgi:hypothetical protein
VPRPRVAMRRISDILRLTFGEGLSRRQVSLSLGVPFTTVADHVNRARAAGLGWPLPEYCCGRGLLVAFDDPTHRLRSLHPSARQEVPVDVLGDADRRVTELLGDHLGRHLHGEQQRCTRVAKLMDHIVIQRCEESR